jgi:hypothetical protein
VIATFEKDQEALRKHGLTQDNKQLELELKELKEELNRYKRIPLARMFVSFKDIKAFFPDIPPKTLERKCKKYRDALPDKKMYWNDPLSFPYYKLPGDKEEYRYNLGYLAPHIHGK